MLASTVDLLTQAASNSLLVFCFCNLIIVMIVMGSKPGSYVEKESEIPVSMVTSSNKYTRNNANCKQVDDAKCKQEEGTVVNPSDTVFSQVSSNAKKELATASDEKDSIISHDNDSKKCDNDDELRRRAEEFIEKMNKGWRAELSRTSHLI